MTACDPNNLRRQCDNSLRLAYDFGGSVRRRSTATTAAPVRPLRSMVISRGADASCDDWRPWAPSTLTPAPLIVPPTTSGSSKWRYVTCSDTANKKQGAPLIKSDRYVWFPNRTAPQIGRAAEEAYVASRSTSCECDRDRDDQHKEKANAENCLPRIIKPRKRRKKDRKPNASSAVAVTVASGFPRATACLLDAGNPSGQDDYRTENSSDDAAIRKRYSHPTLPLQPWHGVFLAPAHPHVNHRRSKKTSSLEGDADTNADDGASSILRPCVSVLAERRTPSNFLSFDNFLGNSERRPTSRASMDASVGGFCNCRYCDPEGIVWDVRRKCFSPNLMPPPTPYPSISVTVDAGSQQRPQEPKRANGDETNDDDEDDDEEDAENPNLSSGGGGGGSAILKRSSSDSAGKATAAAQIVPRMRAYSDSYKTTDKNLQVSSQIVTSLNGHRDIEIKFYSSVTNATSLKL